jgi:hypothetical protein
MVRRWEGLPNIEPNEQPSARPLTSTHTMPRLHASQSDPQIDPVLLKILTDLTDAIRLLILAELASSDNERENICKIVLAQRVNQRDNKKLVEYVMVLDLVMLTLFYYFLLALEPLRQGGP